MQSPFLEENATFFLRTQLKQINKTLEQINNYNDDLKEGP
jgi:hypothetical protein